MLVGTILQSKGSKVVTVKPDTAIAEVAATLASAGIGAVVVSGGGGRIDGILSERDIVKSIARHGEPVLRWKAEKVMTRKVVTCSSADHVDGLMATMTDHHIRHLPVAEDGVLIGIISIGDVVKSRVAEIEHEAQALRDYVMHG